MKNRYLEVTGLTTLMILLSASPLLSGCATYTTPYEAEKVAVCHKGNKTLLLPESAVSAHLGHGDALGACG